VAAKTVAAKTVAAKTVAAKTVAAKTGTLTLRREHPGWHPNERPPPKADPAYPPEYGACDPSMLCRRHNLLAPFFRGSDGLRINGSGAGRTATPFLCARLFIKRVMDHLQSPSVAPTAKVFPGDCPRHQIMGQQTPGAAGSQLIENGVNHFAQRILTRPTRASVLGFGPNTLQFLPLLVCQIGRINGSS